MRGKPRCMEEKQNAIEAVISWLEQYRENEEEIDGQLERLERLESRMQGISAQVLTGMPRSPSASTDRMADMLSQKEDLEQTINDAVLLQKTERVKIEAVLKRSCKPEEKSVIRMRYIDKSEWKDVMYMLYGGKQDFLDREDSYERRMYRKRDSALQKMARYLEETGQLNTVIPAI